jgi:hypothetical protein
MILGALLELLLIIANIGTAVVIVPMRNDPGVPVGAVPRPVLHLQGLQALVPDPAGRRSRRSRGADAMNEPRLRRR